MSRFHYSYSVANIFADDLLNHVLGNKYNFSMDGSNFIIDATNSNEGLVETSHIVFDGNNIIKDDYQRKVDNALIKEYTTTYSFDKVDIPSCPNHNLI